MEYTNILKQLRENYQLTQEEVAKILKISRGLYSQYEISDKIIPLKHLNTLCNYFNISFDYIFNFTKQTNYNNSKENLDAIEIGNRLKDFRKENKITQDKLAKELNTSHSVISAYEKGKTIILTSFLYALCKKYNISADYLLGKINEPKYLK